MEIIIDANGCSHSALQRRGLEFDKMALLRSEAIPCLIVTVERVRVTTSTSANTCT